MGKRKICCFCERWASGGIEAFVYNLLQEDLSGLEVDVVAERLEKNVRSEELEARGVRFVSLSGHLHRPGNYRKFRRLLRQRQYDVVHLNLYQGMSLYYARIARQEGVPVRIAHSHNAALRKSPARWLKLLLHRFGRRRFTEDATALWACSEAAGDFLFAREARFIPNGIDTRRFSFDPAVRERLRRELGLEDCFVLGNLGRLCSQKNQRFLLEVFAHLVQLRPNSRLLLVGDGEDRSRLERQARRLGIRQQVIFFGHTREPERLLWVTDVFALPSLFEGLPLAAVEAQAAGVPVVCADHLAAEVKIRDDLHFLSLNSGAALWAERILTMKQEARQQAARQVREAGFEAHDAALQILQVYLGRQNG